VIHVGSAGWNIPRAHRARFPEAGSQLQRYAARLNAAEVNTSFYRPHAAATYERWAAAVPPDFRFSVKIPKLITHERGLTRAREPLLRFLEEIAGLGPRLGPLLVQLPPSHAFDARRVGRFFELLRASHSGPVVCEPRHETWASPAAEALLVKFRVARVAADPPRVPGLDVPAGWPGIVYYRWHGSPRPYFSPYSMEQLRTLAVKLVRGALPLELPDTLARGSPRPRAVRVAHPLRSFAEEDRGTEVWCIFDNTGSGSAAGNALDLRESLSSPLHSASSSARRQRNP
jgi:uncharacterized protein YecE (DUF72 family)